MTEGEKAIIERLDRLHALLLDAFGGAKPPREEHTQELMLVDSTGPAQYRITRY